MPASFRIALPALMVGLACALPGAGSAPAQTLPLTAPLPRPAPLPKEGALPQTFAPTAIVPAAPTAPTPPAAVTAPSTTASTPVSPLATPRTAMVFNPAQRAAVERVNAYLNGVSQLFANFVQIGPDGSRTEGKLYMQKPKVRFEYDPPSPVELISDGSSIAVRDRKLVTQDIYPQAQTPLRFLLAEKIDLLRDANVVGVYQDELFITVVIEENSPVTGTHRLMIMYGIQDSQLKQWTVTDPQGYDTTVAVYNLDTTKKPDPRLFEIDFRRILQ
jgi:outer membrane lipoprotein-sorting protein